jgi:STE24 endopeptidase
MLTWLLLAFIALRLGIALWLSRRQIAAVMAHRDTVPAAFADKVTLSAHQKAADYTVVNQRFGFTRAVIECAILVALTLAGGLNLLSVGVAQLAEPYAPHAALGSVLHGVLLFAALGLITTLIELPLDAWQTFKIEARFGFNRTTPGVFTGDLIKGLVVGAVLLLPVAALIIWLMQTAGSLWWLWAWVALIVFQFSVMLIYPTFIAPLFNKFTPLSDATLKERIDALLARCGFASNGVFVMDGSKRSAHGNAYFTGLAKNKRIVFFDTLLEKLDPLQIEAVLAHELGHFKHKHITKRLISSSLIMLGGLALLGYLAEQSWFYEQLGVAPILNGSNAALALILFMFVLPVFTYVLSPVGAWFSRKHEFEADAFAVQTSGAEPLKTALVKLFEDNAATLTPDPIYAAFYYSHPPAPVRIAHIQAQAEKHPTPLQGAPA